MKSVLGLQSIPAAKVSDKAASPEEEKIFLEKTNRWLYFLPADPGGLIPENIELVYGAELAEEFLEFILKRRTFEACQQLTWLDKVHHHTALKIFHWRIGPPGKKALKKN